MTGKEEQDGSEKKTGRGSRSRRGRGRGERSEKSETRENAQPDSTDAGRGARSSGGARSSEGANRSDGGGSGGSDGGGESRRRERGRSGGVDRGRDRRRRRGRTGTGQAEVEELGASSGIDVLDMPTDRRRPRDGRLEPGLTLKDLLPFLRPPKTVVVLGASTGGGHHRTATALFEAFKQLDRNLVVRQHDVLELVKPDLDASAVRDRLEQLSSSPALFGTPFETTGEEPETLPDDLDAYLGDVFGPKLDQLVVDKRPDHIICTHWLPFARCAALREEEKLTAPVTAVISDPDIHVRWVNSVVSHYLVPHEGIRARLQSFDVDPLDITVAGTPVSPSFAEAADRSAVLRSLELRGQVPVVLLRPGGMGSTERIVEIVGRLLEVCEPMNLLVVAGRNERLREELEKLEVSEGSAVRAFGFVQNMAELMKISDLMITRASPHTVAEAGAAGLPLLLLRPTAGVEDRMADRLMRSGVARKVSCAEDLEFRLGALLKNSRQLRDMQDAAERRSRPEAVSAAVERLAKLVK